MNEDTHEERTLALKFKEGDEEAYTQIWKRYYPQLCYFAMQIIGDQGEAEDIATETFLKLSENYQAFDTMYNIRGFIFQVTRRQCYNYRTQKKYRSDILAKVKDSMEQTEESFYLEEFDAMVIQKLKAAVDTLPSEAKRMFKMIFYQEMNTREVAQELGVTEDAVRSGKRYAIKLLKARLSQHHLIAAWSLYLLIKECDKVFPSKIHFP